MTTLENMEGFSHVRFQDTQAPSSSHSQLSRLLNRPDERPMAHEPKLNVYNVGLWGNWAAVFGPQWQWCWAPCGKLCVHAAHQQVLGRICVSCESSYTAGYVDTWRL